MKKAVGTITVILGVALVIFSLLLKCYMFGFSNLDGSEHITIYAYTMSEEKTKKAVDGYFSDVFVIAAEEAENLKASDIDAIHAKVYLSGPEYVENDQRSFLDRFYTLFLMAIGAVIMIIGINLLSERIDED